MENEELVARIYEAAALPDRWPALLDELGRAVGARGGTIARYAPAASAPLCSPDLEELAADWIAGGWHMDNQRIAPLLDRSYPGFLTDLDLHSAEARAAMPCYTEFWSPRKADLGAGTAIQGSGEDKVALTLEAFPDEQALLAAVPRLDALRSHLARAAVLSAELQMRETRAAVEALDRAGSPAAMLGRRGQIIAANARFEDALGAWIVDGRDRLRMLHRAADAAFQNALGPLTEEGRGCSIALRDGLGRGVAALHLIPTRRAARDVFTGASALALIALPSGLRPPEPGLLQALFDLTPAESAVARAIAGGSSVEMIAGASVKSVETVRSHLKRVYSKTGTGRQSELTLLLLRMAAPPS